MRLWAERFGANFWIQIPPPLDDTRISRWVDRLIHSNLPLFRKTKLIPTYDVLVLYLSVSACVKSSSTLSATPAKLIDHRFLGTYSQILRMLTWITESISQ